MFKWIWKWMVCSLLHRTYWDWRWPDEPEGSRGPWEKHNGRCYPRCDIQKGYPGSDDWHCVKCHPCYEQIELAQDKEKRTTCMEKILGYLFWIFGYWPLLIPVAVILFIHILIRYCLVIITGVDK